MQPTSEERPPELVSVIWPFTHAVLKEPGLRPGQSTDPGSLLPSHWTVFTRSSCLYDFLAERKACPQACVRPRLGASRAGMAPWGVWKLLPHLWLSTVPGLRVMESLNVGRDWVFWARRDPCFRGLSHVASLGWRLFHRIFVKNSWMLRVTGRFSRVYGPLGDASRAWTPVGDQWDGSGPKVDFLWVETMERQVPISWYGWPGLQGSDKAHSIWLYGPPSSFLLVYTTSRI